MDRGVSAGNVFESQTEQRVAEVWREVLNVESVDPTQGFFDLGGNSVLLLRARRLLVDIFGKRIPIVTLIQFPTVRRLATAIDQISATEGRTDSEILPAASTAITPTHPAQRTVDDESRRSGE